MRKVLGASVANLVLLLNRDITLLVVFSAILAAPLTYFAMNPWLDAFAYRIDIAPLTFVVAGVSALGVMWLTVAFQSLKAAVADPVKSLRCE